MGIAHELITRGWTQGVFERDDGRVCLEGAIECALFGEIVHGLRSPEQMDTRHEVFRVLRDLIGGESIYSWNDADGRSFDEVLRVAKEADEILGAS